MVRAVAAVAALLIVLVVLILAIGLALARLLRARALDVHRSVEELDLEVAALAESSITLRGTRRSKGDWKRPGMFGLIGADAHHTVGNILEERPNEVLREYQPGRGTLAVGDRVRLDSFVFEGDPLVGRGLAFEPVTVDGALGPMPAWFVPGQCDTWVVLVHGKGAHPRETLRILPLLSSLGLPCLAITYRNDDEAPDSHDRWYGYGRHEWEDLESAVRYAVDHGARRVTLYGFSMGGSIALAFLIKSPFAENVNAVVLDAPVLDLRETVAHGAAQAGIPRRLLAYGHRIVSRRYGLDWDEVDYLQRTASIEPPILLFHGEADAMVPVSTSRALAAALPELVTYVEVPGAGHVHSWNVDPARYEAAVRDFLTANVLTNR